MGLGKVFMPQACTVYCQNGEYLIKTPTGEMIPCLHWIRVSDNWSEGPATLIAKMQCNIASNNEHFDLPVKVYSESEFILAQKSYTDLFKRNNELIKKIETIQSKWWYKLFKNL